MHRGIMLNVRATPRMPQDHVLEDLRRVKRRRPSWVAWNELGKVRRYRRALRQVFPEDRWLHLFLPRRNVLTLDRRQYRVVWVDTKRLHRGKVRVNPARYDALVCVEDKATGQRHVLEVTHWPNGAWNRKPKRAKAWRRRMWRRCWRVTADRVADVVDMHLPVAGGGDLNRARVDELHPRWEWQHDGRRIVKTWTCQAPGGPRIVVERRRVIPKRRLHTDKPGLVLDYRLED